MPYFTKDGKTYWDNSKATSADHQNDPVNQLIASGQYRDIPQSFSQVHQGYIGGRVSQEEALAAIRGTPTYNPALGPQVDSGNGPQTFNPDQKGQGYNAPGQGFFNPQILTNAANAISERLKGVSTQVATTVPSRNAPTKPATPTAPTGGTTDAGAAGSYSSPDEEGGFGELMKSLRGMMATAATPPAPPNMAGNYASMQEQSGVTGAQTDLANAQNDLRAFEETILGEQDKIKTQPVATTVIGRRTAKLTADTAEAYRQKQAAVSEATSRLQMANQTLNTLIDLKKFDYQTGAQEYDRQFDRNFKMMDSMMNMLEFDDKKETRLTTEARANYKIFTDALSEKPGIELTPQMKAQAEQYETMIGLPLGFTESWHNAMPGKEILFHTTDNGVTKVFYKDPKTGGVGQVQTFGSPNPKDAELLSVDDATKLGVEYGTTKAQAFGIRPKKPLGETQASDLTQARLAKRNVQRLTELVDELGDQGPVIGRFRQANPYDSRVVQFNALLTQTVPGLARGIFKEVGVLTDQDIKRYSETLASPKLTKDQAKTLLNEVMGTVNASINTQLDTLNKAGRDVRDFEDLKSSTSAPRQSDAEASTNYDWRKRVQLKK